MITVFFLLQKRLVIKKKISKLDSNLYNTNKNLFLSYVNHYIKIVAQINQLILKNDDPLFLFGAHIFSQFLINFGLYTNKILYIIDNDPDKQGKRLYGTDLIVKSPKILKDYNKPQIILNAGSYNEEIKSDIRLHINRDSTFI